MTNLIISTLITFPLYDRCTIQQSEFDDDLQRLRETINTPIIVMTSRAARSLHNERYVIERCIYVHQDTR